MNERPPQQNAAQKVNVECRGRGASVVSAVASEAAGNEQEAPKRTAAQRVLSVLGAFAHGDGSLRLSEISRHADLPLPTAHRLVRELLEWGGLDVDEQGRYRLSRRFLDLASASTSGMRMRELAVPHLVDLHRRTGLSVQLAVRDDHEVVYLDALRAHPNWSGANRIGGRLPLHVTATGLVLLADAAPDDIEDFASKHLSRFTEFNPATPSELKAVLARVRRDGYCISEKFVAHGAGAIAAPIHDSSGKVVAAIGAVFRTGTQSPAPLVDPVRLYATRISAALSANSTPLDQRTIDFNRRRAGIVSS
ncbi:IclR family transcriptional regulator [Pseudoclavibacter endophyticus]|nr:IclR family transcriptional regulator [Pseudoclavibacter endophyticus]